VQASSKTDSVGGFELRLLAGVSFVVMARIRTADGVRQAEAVVFAQTERKSLLQAFH
jgi:hypothetical protein